MRLRLYRRGRSWWASGGSGSGRIRRSLHTTYKDVAEVRVHQLEMDLERGAGVVAWTKFQNEFLVQAEQDSIKPRTFQKYAFVIRRFERFLAIKGLDAVQAITPATISEYVQHRRQDKHPTRGTHIGQAGINADLRVLRRVFFFARERGYIEKSPVTFRNLNSQGGKTQPFNQAEIDAMLADAKLNRNPWLRAAVLLLLHTGLRIGDVVQFPKAALDFASGVLILRTEKRGKIVSLPMHPALREALEQHLAALSPKQGSNRLLFPTENGKPATSLDQYLGRLFQRAGVAGGHAHRFRDTYAVRLLAKGASLYDVAKLLGITVQTAEQHYTPWVLELQERARKFVEALDFVGTNRSHTGVEK